MTQENKNIRISGWIEPELQQDVAEEAELHTKNTGMKVSFNQMMQILLKQAIKERKRQREKAAASRKKTINLE